MTYLTICLIGIVIIIIAIMFLPMDGLSSSNTTDQNQPIKIDENTASMLFFTAKWCPYCREVRPKWLKYRQNYDDTVVRGSRIKCTEVDCSDLYNITSFPTFILATPTGFHKYDPTANTLGEFTNEILESQRPDKSK
jgi:thiol-disulfide isomerase/thioredoxin